MNGFNTCQSEPGSAALGGRLALGFLASHTGTSMRTIVEACRAGVLRARPAVVISNNADAPALAFAEIQGIPARHISAAATGGGEAVDRALRAKLQEHGVSLVILSGYLRKVGPLTLAAYRDRMLNIHPALLPRFGGRGLYGAHVHAAVLAAGERVSGATVHLVDEHYDHGSVLAQETVPVLPDDTVESLQARVAAVEAPLFVRTLRQVLDGTLRLPAGE